MTKEHKAEEIYTDFIKGLKKKDLCSKYKITSSTLDKLIFKYERSYVRYYDIVDFEQNQKDDEKHRRRFFTITVANSIMEKV